MAKDTKLIRKKEVEHYIPKNKLSINLANDLADHAAELLWGQGFLAKTSNEIGTRHLNELLTYNRAEEFFPYLERQLSLWGNMYVTIDMFDGKPTWTIADPMLNVPVNTPNTPNITGPYGIGRAMVTDEVAVIWKRITSGAVSFPIKETWDKEKVTRTFYGNNNQTVTLAQVQKKIPEAEALQEVWYHNMGFVPVIWFKNTPTWNALAFPDGYKGASLQALVDKTMSELWHETETNRTRIIGNMDESTYNQLMKNGDLAEINKNDFLINVKFSNSTGLAQNTLIPVVADPKFEQYWLSIKAAKDQYYQLGGYSPLGDGTSEKTATENLLMKTNDYQTTKKKRNQRMSEVLSLVRYSIAIDSVHGFGNVYGDLKKVSFEIMENKVMDSLQEVQNLSAMEKEGYMSKIEVIAKVRGVSEEEAEEIFKKIAKQKQLEQSLMPEDKEEESTGKEGNDEV